MYTYKLPTGVNIDLGGLKSWQIPSRHHGSFNAYFGRRRLDDLDDLGHPHGRKPPKWIAQWLVSLHQWLYSGWYSGCDFWRLGVILEPKKLALTEPKMYSGCDFSFCQVIIPMIGWFFSDVWILNVLTFAHHPTKRGYKWSPTDSFSSDGWSSVWAAPTCTTWPIFRLLKSPKPSWNTRRRASSHFSSVSFMTQSWRSASPPLELWRAMVKPWPDRYLSDYL